MSSKQKKMTGVVVPLGALYTKNNAVIGEFADLISLGQFCKSTGLGIIQLLPVNDSGTQSSPYSALSAFALHPIYIRLSDIPLFKTVYETDSEFKKNYDAFVKAHEYSNRYKYDEILNSKNYFLQELFKNSDIYKDAKADTALEAFIKNNQWVKIYSVYKNLKWKYMQAGWKEWKKEDRELTPAQILQRWDDKSLKKDHLFYAWCQLIAAEQFKTAVDEVHKMGILVKGDMPILMNEDSCDVWAYPEYFNLALRAGSPSDGENPSGQNWGFPTYNWKNLKADNYSWWIDRLKTAQKYYDAYRLDHILGFFRIWAIPEEDCNALTGHTEPYSFLKKEDLYNLAFDDDRIRWLSQPHIPTYVIEEITQNHETAQQILSLMCDRIGSEELWLFKKTIKGSRQLKEMKLEKQLPDLSLSPQTAQKICQKLVEYWANRTLLEISKNKYVPLWTYGSSTSWNSLNDKEKEALTSLFSALDKKNEKLWKKQADEIFTSITSNIKMIPCGEDLGVGIKCVPETMKKHGILGLRVVRWTREWDKEDQPYVPLDEYEPLSVTTTSVHDSSTMRDWLSEDFSPDKAFEVLKKCSNSASIWYIPPLQDFLYMNKKYWLEKAEDERVNVPGTVTSFNWTYRMPVSLENLVQDKDLIKKIQYTSKRNCL